MTSDAKIGLLLGLVFIFIIAFIINGLPSLRSDGGETSPNSVLLSSQNESPGLGGRERRASEAFDWRPPSGDDSGLSGGGQGDDGIRFTSPLPHTGFIVGANPFGSDPGVLEDSGLPGGSGVEEVGPVMVKDVKSWRERLGDEAVRTVVLTDKPAGSASGSTIGETGIERQESTGVVVLQDQPEAQAKKYVVEAGDTLAVIAKRFYGAEEGNRLANINRIFEANKGVLKSPDRIVVGQELLIPAISGSKAVKSPTLGYSGGVVFESVRSVGGGVPGAASGFGEGRVYVVKEGDSLWKIAAEQLGNGSRYEEIYKLNPMMMNDADSVVVGMRLRLPGGSGSVKSLGGGVGTLKSLGGGVGAVKSFVGGVSRAVSASGEDASYVVKEGDSLWRIAAEQLGKGSRYKEIYELNPSMMNDADRVVVGMRLRLPAR